MESGFVKEVTKEMDVQEGKVEPVILFHFCIGRKQSSELDEAMGTSRRLCQGSWNKHIQTSKDWEKMN